MNRVVSKDVSRFFQSEHEDKGVRFLFNQNINYFSGENGNVAKIHLSSNETIQSDLVLVGVGGVPNIEIADNTKIEIDNGIKVDSTCRIRHVLSTLMPLSISIFVLSAISILGTPPTPTSTRSDCIVSFEER